MSDAGRLLIVVGVDGSDHGMVALEAAISEAKAHGADLHVVYVTDVTPATLHLGDALTVDTSVLAEAQRQGVWGTVGPVIDAGGHPVTRVDLDGYPADALVDYAEEKRADLLVVGTRGRGRIASTFLGSTSSRALDHARCDVLVAKPPRT
jgi:nucleotide-binding universal stress UspA family protein